MSAGFFGIVKQRALAVRLCESLQVSKIFMLNFPGRLMSMKNRPGKSWKVLICILHWQKFSLLYRTRYDITALSKSDTNISETYRVSPISYIQFSISRPSNRWCNIGKIKTKPWKKPKKYVLITSENSSNLRNKPTNNHPPNQPTNKPKPKEVHQTKPTSPPTLPGSSVSVTSVAWALCSTR